MNKCILPKSIILIATIIPAAMYSHSLNEVWMQMITKELGEDLDVMKNEELGRDYIQKVYSTFKYTSVVLDTNKTINAIAQSLDHKITEVFGMLAQAKVAIQTLDNKTKTTSTLIPCKKTSITNVSLDQSTIDSILQEATLGISLRLKQQYYLSSSSLDCHQVDHIWSNFIARKYYKPKHIILLLDHGSALHKDHLSLVKLMGKQLIESLTARDKIAILAISNECTSPQLSDECLMPNQVPLPINEVPKLTLATPGKKKILYKFIDAMSTAGPTNHSLGFEKALRIIEQRHIQNETIMMLYVGQGLSSAQTKAVSESTADLAVSVIINTGSINEDHQDENYNSSRSTGITLHLNSSERIGFLISVLFETFTDNLFNVDKAISLPTWNSLSDDLTISFTMGMEESNDFALLGTDLYFESWAEDLLYFHNNERDYAFLIDMQGRAIIHPRFPSLLAVKQKLHFVDISHFENVPFFHVVKQRMLDEVEGTYSATHFGSSVTWTWKRVSSWYVVCMVTREVSLARPVHVEWPSNSSSGIELIYHNLDKEKMPRVCRHLNQIATLDAGSLHLSASCFETPSNIQNLKSSMVVHNYMAYLQDNSQLLINPGLKEETKDEVSALAYVLDFLRTQHLTSLKMKYIIRRYVASYNGVLEMFPGSLVNQAVDPTRRPWFVKAVEHKSKLVMIPPYLDEGGAGYIVSVAFATSDAVVALDVTYGYIFKLLLKRMPFCLLVNITCFLMDDRGYLIYHPNLIDPNDHGPVEKQHIVHKESLVANDILGYDFFMKKSLCNSYGGGTVQRYYKLNTSYDEVLFSSVQGENCVSYHIAAVPNTNVFVGVVNATCNVVVTFCPCSIVDRLCLNCNRMEQRECECPCECPIEETKCAELNNGDNLLCTWFPEHAPVAPYFHSAADLDDVKSCFPAACGAETTHMGCLGVAGCEWCKYDVDGSPLENPFCDAMATCFNGVLGSLTPYRNSLHELEVTEETLNVPITVIALFIFGVFLLLCMFYVYHRFTTPPTAERLYLSSTQDNHLRMSDLNLSDHFHTTGTHRDKLLQDDVPDSVSPYCVSGSYKRTTFAADSDHGYSTMTQHDESEHMSLAPLEDDMVSENASLYKTATAKPREFTAIPKNKCIIVPVTVHKNVETV